MPKQSRMTFGQLLDFFHSLGFTTDEMIGHNRICRHAESDTWFAYQNRTRNAYVFSYELISLRYKLDQRGLVSEADFDDFLHAAAAQVRTG